MQRAGAASKASSLRRAELLVLELQKDILDYRIRCLEKQGPSKDRGLKRESPLDRNKTVKRPKQEPVNMTLDEMFSQCSKLLTQLKKNNNAGPFSAPVDPIALNCPDYFKIVKKPMDFKTITTRLRPAKRIYKSPLEFRNDVRQVFKNCSLYNPVGNQIRIMGDRLSEYFETLWAKSNIENMYMKTEQGLKRGRDEDEGDEKERSKKIRTHDNAYSLKKLNGLHKKLLELLQKAETASSMMIVDADVPLSFWHKRRLNAALETADAETTSELAKLLPKKPESAEVFVDDADDATLRDLWNALIASHQRTEADPVLATSPTDMHPKLATEEAVDVDRPPVDAIISEDGIGLNQEAAEKLSIDLLSSGPEEKPATAKDEAVVVRPDSTVDTEAFGSVIPMESVKADETMEPTIGEATVEGHIEKTRGEFSEVVQQVPSEDVEDAKPSLKKLEDSIDGEVMGERIDEMESRDTEAEPIEIESNEAIQNERREEDDAKDV